MDRDKVQAVLDWPLPTTISQLRGFLGLTGYYKWFVRNFAIIASPLTDLLKKNAFSWTTNATTTFRHLQQALLEAPVLQLPDFAKNFSVETNASGMGIGVVLAQEGHPIAYFSKKLLHRMQQSSAYSREVFAITQAVKRWRQYLLGRHFIIKTDHQSLKGLIEQTIQTPEQQKWLTKLLGYDFTITYRPGRDNKVADALSRHPTNPLLAAVSQPQLS